MKGQRKMRFNNIVKSLAIALPALLLLNEQLLHFELFQHSAVLDAHAAFLSENSDVKVLIEGHADERGTPEYNIALGERRAKSVVTYLETMGVSASQLSIVSYGEEKPMIKDRSEDAFAKNRRAVLVY
jgi:peptidoglycan-associated lipoprotein